MHIFWLKHWTERRTLAVCGLIALWLLSGGALKPASAMSHGSNDKQGTIDKLKEMEPARGYLDAHKDLQKPLELLGGPITVTVSQEVGGVHVGLPDNRRLDPRVFGTPERPLGFGGTPVVTGVPPAMRGTEGDAYTVMQQKSPFGDKHVVLGNGKLQLRAVDVTATDAAVSRDKVEMQASWQDEEENTYTVKCCDKLATHGIEYPTFGGVLTNHMHHGFTRIGTPLMPSLFSYVAFWGMGEVSKNGQVLDKPRLVHGMLTEYVRKKGYELGFDDEVTPTRLHFHIMVPPVQPVPEASNFTSAPVKTGFTLPNGQALPFWHVMFGNLDINATRGNATSQ